MALYHYQDIVLDNYSKPVAGASITIKLTGTSTLSSLYSDSGGTIPVSNPITTDNLGRFDAYIAPGLYDVTVSGNSLVSFTETTVAIGVSGTGAMQSLNNIRFADQFAGADIFAKANAAITDIGANPGWVIIPPATYTGVTTTLSVTSANISILANGASVTFATTGKAVRLNAQNVSLEGLRLFRSGAAGIAGDIGINVEPSAHHYRIENVQVGGATNANFYNGIQVESAYYGSLQDCDSYGHTFAGYHVTNGGNTPSMLNCNGRGGDTATKIQQYGIRIDDTTSNLTDVTVIGGSFEGNLIENCEIAGADWVCFIGNHFEQSPAVALGTVTFTNASTAITSTGLFAASQVGKYIKADAHTAAMWMKIASVTDANNAVLTDQYQGATVSGAASLAGGNIHVVNGSTTASRCMFINPDVTVSSGTAPGIYIQSGTDHRVISGGLNLGVVLGASTSVCSIDVTSLPVDYINLGSSNFVRGASGVSNGPDIISGFRVIAKGNSIIPAYVQAAVGQSIDLVQLRDSGGTNIIGGFDVNGGLNVGGVGGGSATLSPAAVTNGNLKLNIASGKIVFMNAGATWGNAGNANQAFLTNAVMTGAPATVSAGQVSFGKSHQTTVGAAGAASVLPATPSGYLEINVDGTAFVLPYYAKV